MTTIQELITFKENLQNTIQGNATRATLPALDVGAVVPTDMDQLQYGAAIGAITKRQQLAKSFYEWPLFKIHVSKFLVSHCNMGTQPEAIAKMLHFGDVNYNTTQGNQSYFDELYRRLVVNYFDETLFIKYHYSGRGFELFGSINKDYQTISIGNEIAMFRNFIDNYRNYDDYKLNKELDICSYYVGGFKTLAPTLYLMKMNNERLTEFLSKNNGLTTRRDLLQLSTDELSRLEHNMTINFTETSEQANLLKYSGKHYKNSFSKDHNNNKQKTKKKNTFNSNYNNNKNYNNNYRKRGQGYSHQAHHLNYESFSDADDYANLIYTETHPDWENIESSYNNYTQLSHLSETDWEDIAEFDTYSDTEWEDVDDDESSTSFNPCYNNSYSVPEDPLFVLDTGSTIHIVNDKSLLTDVRPSSTRIISIHNKHPIQYVGDIHIGKVILENVALVEHSPSNIISVPKLNKIGVNFESTDGYAHLVQNGEIIAKAKKYNKLWCLSLSEIENAIAFHIITTPNSQINNQDILTTHISLGHASAKKTSVEVHRKFGFKVSAHQCSQAITNCTCQTINHHKTHGKRLTKRDLLPGERIHIDLIGPINNAYALISTDAKTKYVTLRILQSKSEASAKAIETLTAFSNLLNLTRRVIISVRTDNEFCTKQFTSFCAQNGINHEVTAPYSSYQNGTAEAMNLHLETQIRTLLQTSHVPLSYWNFALRHAVYLHNYTSIDSSIPSPWEQIRLTNKTLSQLAPFGCKALAYNSNHVKKLFKDHYVGTFFGYDKTEKIAFIFVHNTGKVIRTSSFKCFPNQFPFKDEGYPSNNKYNPILDYTTNDITFNPESYDNLINQLPPPGCKPWNPPLQPKVSSPHIYNTVPSTTPAAAPSFKPTRFTAVPLVPNKRLLTNTSPNSSLSKRQQFRHLAQTAIKRSVPLPNQVSISKRVQTRYPGTKPPDKRAAFSQLHSNLTKRSQKHYPGTKPPDKRQAASQLHHTPLKQPRTLGTTGTQALTPQQQPTQDIPTETTNLLVSNTKYTIPKSFKDVLSSPQKSQWIKAMQSELQAMSDLNVYTSVSKNQLPSNSQLIKGRWVFNVKHEADGSERFKARLVAKGFTQKKGDSYLETYSPVVNMSTLRLMLSISAINKYDILQVDVNNAFLNGSLKQPIYFQPPSGPNSNPATIWKLQKALYGLKNSPLIFYETLRDYLMYIGFKVSSLDPCLFYTKHCFIIAYVDDLLILSNTSKTSNYFLNLIQKEFKVKNLGKPNIFLGMTIHYFDSHIQLSMADVIHKIKNDFNITTMRREIAIPVDKGSKIHDLSSPELSEKEHQMYRRIVGILNYLSTRVRYDVAYGSNLLSQQLDKPRTVHLKLAKRMLHYVIQTADFSITYKSHRTNKIKFEDFRLLDTNKDGIMNGSYPHHTQYIVTTFSDSDFASDHTSRKSQSGYFTLLNNNIINWCSNKQKLVAISSAEAEYVALTEALKDNVFIRNILNEIKFKTSFGELCGDNMAALNLASHNIKHNRTKHIDVKFHFIRNHFLNKSIRINYVNTTKNIADMLTKALDKTTLTRLYNLIQ